MKGSDLIAEILKREGTEFLSCYPRNELIEACARADIRPIICRQERVGVGIADGYSRSSRGERIGVFAAQAGPGIENAYAGVRQAYADNVPVLVLPGGGSLARPNTRPLFYPADDLASSSKWTARVHRVNDIPALMHRAFHQLRTGRPGPVVLELTPEAMAEDASDDFEYTPVRSIRNAPDPADVAAAAQALIDAKSPILWAGQGVLRADASDELVMLAEQLGVPVMTTNPGKSAFPENHELSLGATAVNPPGPLKQYLDSADLIFAIGSSLTITPFNPNVPAGKRVIQSTNCEDDINKDHAVELGLVGDAKLTLQMIIDAVRDRAGDVALDDARKRGQETRDLKQAWLAGWQNQLASDETPINPYRLISDIMKTVDRDNTIITHDAGSPREHLVPFYEVTRPGGYIGWGKSTQLGHGLGLIMGAKMANPDKLCINWMGDAAFCMVGMDLDTAARNRIPILTIVLNNGVMACERDQLVTTREKYDAFDIGGNYSKVAEALGVWSRRVEDPANFIPILRDAIATTETGHPALIECITKQCYDFAP
jgi:acetolactate synthase-1/2/3 large subunit